MRDQLDLIKLIGIRLDAIAKDEYASKKMTQQAAKDALKDLDALELLVRGC